MTSRAPAAKKPVEQKRPDFARPRERPLGHQLQRAIIRQFFRQTDGGSSSVLWSIPRKTKSGRVGRLPAFALEKIFEVCSCVQTRGEKRKPREKMDRDDAPEQSAQIARHDQTPMTAEPSRMAGF